MRNMIKKAVAQRAHGERPGAPRAALVAVAAGAAAAGLTYRLMRA